MNWLCYLGNVWKAQPQIYTHWIWLIMVTVAECDWTSSEYCPMRWMKRAHKLSANSSVVGNQTKFWLNTCRKCLCWREVCCVHSLPFLLAPPILSWSLSLWNGMQFVCWLPLIPPKTWGNFRKYLFFIRILSCGWVSGCLCADTLVSHFFRLSFTFLMFLLSLIPFFRRFSQFFCLPVAHGLKLNLFNLPGECRNAHKTI